MENINQDRPSGEMLKNDRIISTVDSLMDGENNQEIIKNLRMYHDADRGSRVSIFHENIEDSGKIMVITESIQDKMSLLSERTAETKKEHAFLVLGWVQGGNYLFNGIASDLDISDEQKEDFYKEHPDFKADDSAADFNILLASYWSAINDHIDKIDSSGVKPLIGLGHTHPNASESYGNYSLPDLVGFSMQEESIRGNRDEGEFEYCHIVLPENGDVDCMTFDKNDNRFKKITNVISVGQSSEEQVPAYTFKSPESLSETSYVKEKDESEEDRIYEDCIEEIIQKYQWDTLAE